MSSLKIETLSSLGAPKFTISTGSLKLDEALNGGLRSSNLYEFFGEESTGKTSLALRILNNALQDGLRPLYIDAELKLNEYSLGETGVSKEIPILRSNSQQQLYSFLLSADFYENFDIVCIDTLTSLISDQEILSPVGSTHSDSAMQTSEFLKKFNPICDKHGIISIFIDQVRYKATHAYEANTKMGYEQGNPFKLSSTACNALEHYSTARIELFEKRDVYETKKPVFDDVDTTPIGQETLFNITKNHQGRPGLRGKFTFIYGSGFSEELELADYGIKQGLLSVEELSVLYKGSVVASTKLELIDFMKNNRDVGKKIRENADINKNQLRVVSSNANTKRSVSNRNAKNAKAK